MLETKQFTEGRQDFGRTVLAPGTSCLVEERSIYKADMTE